MLEACLFFCCVSELLPFIWFNKLFLCSRTFISVPTKIPHYLCNGNIFHFASLSTVDNVTFFMIQLIIFDLNSFYLYLDGGVPLSPHVICQLWSLGRNIPKIKSEIWWMDWRIFSHHCCFILHQQWDYRFTRSSPRIFHASIKFAII